jgi:hypothetical protein
MADKGQLSAHADGRNRKVVSSAAVDELCAGPRRKELIKAVMKKWGSSYGAARKYVYRLERQGLSLADIRFRIDATGPKRRKPAGM